MNNYLMLSQVIQFEFSHELQMNRDESVKLLKNSLNEGYYDLNKLKDEFELALNDEDFEWVQFACDNKFIWDKNSYNDEDIKNHLKYYLWDLLYPEQCFSTEYIKQLVKSSLKILEAYRENEGWMLMENLYAQLIKEKMFLNLEYYNMYHFLVHNRYQIEGRSESGKGKEIIYFRKK